MLQYGKSKEKVLVRGKYSSKQLHHKKNQSRKFRENKIDNKTIPKKAYTAAVKKDLVTITQLPFQIIFQHSLCYQSNTRYPTRIFHYQLWSCGCKASENKRYIHTYIHTYICWPWHDTWAVPSTRAVTSTNQEKLGLGGGWKARPRVKLHGLISPTSNSK